MSLFNYAEMTKRNLGFVNPEEQQRLRDGTVFVVGVGGMGGACIQNLVRLGVGRFIIADQDEFEVSNLNRQVFANLNTIGKSKAQSTAEAIKLINPECQVTVYGADWIDHLGTILQDTDVVVNGMDDLASGIELYRKAKIYDATVIDAYTAANPSVFVVKPTDPRPEERFNYPTRGIHWKNITPDMLDVCKRREFEFVLSQSSSLSEVHLDIVSEMMKGSRARISMAPMVIMTGTLMAYEVYYILTGHETSTTNEGYFFNPRKNKVEHPQLKPVATVTKYGARIALNYLMDKST
ncbi:MAG: ThiF family adenylyltransferase [Bdellovibrionales bacterium]|nr:ThiF family adenylyltransferase [Bdellovibrionales bacterium]